MIDEIDDEPVYASAEALATQGLDVTLVTRRPSIGRHVPWVNLLGIFRRLDDAGVRVQTMTVPDRVEGDRLVLKHSFSGRELALPSVTTAVRAGPFAPATPLETGLRTTLTIGDALSPRGLHAVTLEAHRAALELGHA